MFTLSDTGGRTFLEQKAESAQFIRGAALSILKYEVGILLRGFILPLTICW